MLILAPATLWNPGALDISNVPRRFLGRTFLWPRPGLGWAASMRLVFEMQVLRYVGSLLPFVLAMVIWPDLALPIAQAPLLMIVAIGLVEMRALSVPKDKRADLVPEAEAAAHLDTLRFRGTKLLRRLAAGHCIADGELTLVVEQSELANIRPLTLVSVQRAAPKPHLLPLTAAERAAITAELFDEGFTERDLALANQREREFLRTVTIDARGVSAHARLAARLARPVPAA